MRGRDSSDFFHFFSKSTDRLNAMAITASTLPNSLMKNAWAALYEDKNQLPVISCHAYIPVAGSDSPVRASILGKFIYTQRSSHPIGIGRMMLIMATLSMSVNTKNASSALRSFGATSSIIHFPDV